MGSSHEKDFTHMQSSHLDTEHWEKRQKLSYLSTNLGQDFKFLCDLPGKSFFFQQHWEESQVSFSSQSLVTQAPHHRLQITPGPGDFLALTRLKVHY